MTAPADVVFRSALVYDGLGNEPVHADVAVDSGRIVAIDDALPLRGRREIPCDGLALCPGFLDAHAHDDLAALMPRGLQPKIRQGVTSTIVGNCGHGVAPSGAFGEDIRDYSSPVLGPGPDAWPWPTYGDYLQALRAASPPLRVHTLVPHGVARMSVMGFEARAATAGEEARIVAAVRAGLDAGAIGVSFGLMYAPACFAARSELVAVAQQAADADAVLSVHLRAEGQHIFEALDEIHDVVTVTGARVHISHLKCTGSANHGQMPRVIEMLEHWREQGLRVTGDVYPYTAGSTTICAMLPESALAGGVQQMLHRLEDPRVRSELIEMLRRPWARAENHLLACGAENIVLSGLTQPASVGFEGKSIADVARARRTTAEAALVDLVITESGRAGVIQHQGSEADLIAALRWKHTMIGSDGLPAGPGRMPHPRLFGTFPRVLGRYVRERSVLTMHDAIRRMTGSVAETFQLAGQGHLAEGAHGDVVIFDPSHVRDNATYGNPRAEPTGILQVWVGGQPVWVDTDAQSEDRRG